MIFDELLLGIDDDLRFFRPVVAARVGFFVGEKVHELEFDAQMIEPLMDIFRHLDAEGFVEAGDVAHHVGLRKHVIIPEQGFVGRTIERNHVAEHAAMFGLQIAQLPVDTFGGDQFLDLVQLLAASMPAFAWPGRPPVAVEGRLQCIEGRPPVLHKFAAPEVIEKFVVFGVQQAPGNQQIELTAIECTFDGGRIFDREDSE